MADAAALPPKTGSAFQANLDRAAPLLKQLRADGIGHLIGGEIVASSSGETFETASPIDNAVLAQVARGTAADVEPLIAQATAINPASTSICQIHAATP